jgi:PadR family transcriptional regulator, regulatory protein PadR
MQIDTPFPENARAGAQTGTILRLESGPTIVPGTLLCKTRYHAVDSTLKRRILGRMAIEDMLENWNVQARKGVLELGLLNALSGERLYGYDIIKRLRSIEGLITGEGTIYPILSRFRTQKLVACELEESPGGPARKYYKLTPRGEELLAQMNRGWDQIEAGMRSLRKEGS